MDAPRQARQHFDTAFSVETERPDDNLLGRREAFPFFLNCIHVDSAGKLGMDTGDDWLSVHKYRS